MVLIKKSQTIFILAQIIRDGVPNGFKTIVLHNRNTDLIDKKSK